jgi:hypothetical protein
MYFGMRRLHLFLLSFMLGSIVLMGAKRIYLLLLFLLTEESDGVSGQFVKLEKGGFAL